MESYYHSKNSGSGVIGAKLVTQVLIFVGWCLLPFIASNLHSLTPDFVLIHAGSMPIDGLLWVFVGGVGLPRRSGKAKSKDKSVKDLAGQENKMSERIAIASQGAIITTDSYGCIIEWEASAQLLFGWHCDEVLGAPLGGLLLHGEVSSKSNTELMLDLNGIAELELRDKGGQTLVAEIHVLERNEEWISLFIRDITRRRREEQRLRRELGFQRTSATILELSTLTLPFEEIMHRVLDAILSSPWLSKQTKGSIFLAEGESMLMLVEQGLSDALKNNCFEVKKGQCLCGLAAQQKRMIFSSHDDPRHHLPHPDIEPHGHYSVPIMHDGTVKGLLVLYLDAGHKRNEGEISFLETVCHTLGYIIHKHEYEQEQQRNANFDLLTGLPNRKVVAERVNLANSKYARDPNRLYAVLFLDLNRFKNINDTLGHAAGDQVLIEFSQRIAAELRCSDSVGRLGGDEFAVLLEEAKSFSSICHVADRLHEVTRAPISINGYDISVSMSIGIAFCDSHYRSFEEILRDADTAMYQAKTMNGSATIIFDEGMRNSAWSFLDMESKLRSALSAGELSVSYQPVFSQRENRFVGAEALIRWDRVDGTSVQPTEFVPIAEESGLIFEMGEYVLREACMLVTQMHSEGLEDFYISVNVSAKQILNRAFVDMLDTVLSDTQVNTRHLHLEITESVFADDLEHVNHQLTEIKRRGIKLLIDDFGTGYSSLSYLSNFPFDALKVDKSFVSEIGREGGTTMVNTIVDLAVNLGMDIIVEGVETEEQVNYVLGLGCYLMQGFYFAHPQAEKEFRKMMTRVV
jgi:diguanylate cyclase (GGDEF)-like protein/PAS domain S-box-containing protein